MLGEVRKKQHELQWKLEDLICRGSEGITTLWFGVQSQRISGRNTARMRIYI